MVGGGGERKLEPGGEEGNEEEEEERGREEEGRQGGEGEDGHSSSAVDQAWGLHLHSREDTPLTFPWPHRAKGTPTGEVEEGVIKIKLKKIFFKLLEQIIWR